MSGGGGETLAGELTRRCERREQYLQGPGWSGQTRVDSELKGVACFRMEFGVSEALLDPGRLVAGSLLARSRLDHRRRAGARPAKANAQGVG